MYLSGREAVQHVVHARVRHNIARAIATSLAPSKPYPK